MANSDYHSRIVAQEQEWPEALQSLGLTKKKFLFLSSYSEAGSNSINWMKKQSSSSTQKTQAVFNFMTASLSNHKPEHSPNPIRCSLPALRYGIILHETLEEGKCESLRV